MLSLRWLTIVAVMLTMTQSAGAHIDPVEFKKLDSSAHKGVARAQYKLGLEYHLRVDSKTDSQQALKWFELAAQQNHIESQKMLGFLYDQGRNINHDVHKAAYWYRKAAQLGDDEAQRVLGYY